VKRSRIHLTPLLLGAALSACNTAGSAWMAQPLDGEVQGQPLVDFAPPSEAPAPRNSQRTQVIRSAPEPELPPLGGSTAEGPKLRTPAAAERPLAGKVLGTFKNTYYDFPSESDFDGETVSLMNGSCKPIVTVPRKFYESVCVQGSGTLKSGGTVSFAKRDCSCAAECPRTGQHICFDLLDRQQFPWGRGATGKGITPLLTVAVDSTVIPLGTPLYIPEYDGVARDPSGTSRHDGCFIAEDRGLAVKGDHVDIFTGHRETTLLWNRLVPSNRGVTVVLDSPRCKRGGGNAKG
jgi:3D (Asp-Asp-Asp) domain-containing protein